MKTNLQFFAEDRTNMVSLLDIGTLIGSTAKIVEMGDGYKEITEDWGPNTESTQYVNMKNANNTVKGYEFSCLMICRLQSTRCSKCSRRESSVRHIITDITKQTLQKIQAIASASRLRCARQAQAAPAAIR